MTVGPVLAQLRIATGNLHQKLDESLDAINRLAAIDSRRDMICGYLAFHTSADAAIAPWLSDEPGLDYALRRRSPALRQALAALEGSTEPTRRPVPMLASRAQAYGALYVVEGSTLGGRLIRKAIADRGCDMVGLDFLDPYGAATGERWRTFLALLEANAENQAAEAARGAIAAFELAAASLRLLEIAT